MFVKLSFLLFLFGCMGLSLSAEQNRLQESENEPIRPQLKLIATVDGKSFFADAQQNRNWTEAKTFCQGLGMKLASITSNAQFEALSRVADTSDFNLWYWTSGRDAHKPRQFSWDTSGHELPDFLKMNWFSGMYTCLLIRAKGVSEIKFEGYDCSSRVGALCET